MLRSLLVAVLGCLSLCLLVPAEAQGLEIIFKDGFTIKGRIRQLREYILDPASKRAIPVAVTGALLSIEDDVRHILFSPGQVLDVIKEDKNSLPDPIKYGAGVKIPFGISLPKVWSVESEGSWDERWERDIKLDSSRGPLNVKQRITWLTPESMRVDSLTLAWMQYYVTLELGPGQVRSLLIQHFMKKQAPRSERAVHISRFLAQVGWYEAAERELNDALSLSPGEKTLEAELSKVRRQLAQQFLEDLERAYKLGRHRELARRFERYASEGVASQLPERQVLAVQDLKNKVEAAQEKLQLAQRLLKELPEQTPFSRREDLTRVAEVIRRELHVDAVQRLETFLTQARDYELAMKQQRKPSLAADNLLALAMTGWLLGNGAAEESPEAAATLWRARRLLQEYLREDEIVPRRQQLSQLRALKGVGPDVVMRLLQLLPPSQPYDVLEEGEQLLTCKAPETSKSDYLLRLPPEYHHQRAHPVLVVLHQRGEKASAALERWSEHAARHGYVLVAPLWGKGEYRFTAKEHDTVLDCLRDLRRRFQIDSDRVFLAGSGDGAAMAFDVGLSHPDQFAGVLPMCGLPRLHAAAYWANAQYLPFYIVEGQLHGIHSEKINRLFKEHWVRWGYPVWYVEYRGRGSEWYAAELPAMFDWMNRKKRAQPLRQVGAVNTSSINAEAFKTMRATDNRFYWLSTAGIHDRCLNDPAAWNPRVGAAAMQATIFSGNQIHVNAAGLKQLSIWLAPSMIDFKEKVTVRVNLTQHGPPRVVEPSLEVLLEDFYLQGDRQRLYLARIDLSL